MRKKETRKYDKVANNAIDFVVDGHLSSAADRQLKRLDTTVAEAQTYDELEKNFERVLKELEVDRSLDRFRTLYENVLQAVRRSHDNEKRLAVKCKQLNEELVGAGARVTAALKLSEEDQTTIATLRKELERTWRQIDTCHDKENKLKAELSDPRLVAEELTKQVEDNKQHDAALDELLKHKQELMQERDNQMNDILSLRQETDHLRAQLKTKEQQNHEVEASLEAIRSEAAAKRAEQERDVKKREKLEKEVRDLKNFADARQVELRNRAAEAQSAENVLKDYEQQIRELHVAANKVSKEHNELVNQGNRLQRELDTQTATCTQLAADNRARASSLKTAEASLAAAKAENGRLSRLAESTAAKLRVSEEKRLALEGTREELKLKIQTLEREKDSNHRELTLLESKLVSMQHERDMLTKLKVQAEGSTHQQLDLVKVHEGHIKVLEAELTAHKETLHQASLREAALMREQDNLALQSKSLTAQLVDAREALEQTNKEKAEIEEQFEEREATVAGQQKAYEQVRSERSRYSRDLIAAQAEVAEGRRKFAHVAHQVEMLREDLKLKEAACLKEKFARSRAETERQTLLTELASAEKAMAVSRQEGETMHSELSRLSSVVSLADQERIRQRKEYETMIADRDVLGTQLIRRNDEVALLYAKLRLQTSALQVGSFYFLHNTRLLPDISKAL